MAGALFLQLVPINLAFNQGMAGETTLTQSLAVPQILIENDPELDKILFDLFYDGNRSAGFEGIALPQQMPSMSASPFNAREFSAPDASPQPVPPSQSEMPPRRAKSTLILVQIDGLGYRQLLEAAKQGRAPNIAALIQNGQFQAAAYRNGIPTVTQAVQHAIFYGKLLPGNEWYSKKRRKEITGNEQELELTEESGILHGGSAYLSELSGGARTGADVNSLYMKDVRSQGTFLAILKELWNGGPLFLRYLLSHNPFVSLPKFFYHLVRDAWTLRNDFKEMGFNTEMDKKAPYFLSLIANLWTPIAVEGLKKAMRDEEPIAYMDFPSYDEEAHYYGSFSSQAFSALERIDKHIGELVETANQYGSRLLIFSDHGQTPTENFIKKYGKRFAQMADEALLQTNPASREGELVFLHVYSMGNIYAANFPGHMSLTDFEAGYPDLIQKLAAHPGVGMVAARDGEAVALFGKNGRKRLAKTGEALLLEGQDPLAPYRDEMATDKILGAQIANYLDIEESGDLVVFAPYENGATLDYNHKYSIISQHGGLGGDQMLPFVLYNPASLPLVPGEWLDARGLHQQLAALLKN